MAVYEKELAELQLELVRMLEWIRHSGHRLVVVFEGRDAAGKGSTISRMANPLNPRSCRVVALPKPTEREKTQWYFQRYVAHLPSAGEMVIFDRSWYNRAGVERVLGFCTDTEYWEFMRAVPEFERMLVRSGIQVVKYWFSVSHEVQTKRFKERLTDPAKRWKYSDVDALSQARWNEYSRAKDVMIQQTSIPESPWWEVDGDDKRRARLNTISHLLSLVPYERVDYPPVELTPVEPRRGLRAAADRPAQLDPREVLTMKIGDTASRTRTVTARDIELFTEMTGDRNPLHYDEDLAKASRFGGIIVQGGVTTGLLNALVAEDLPGPGSVFLHVDWSFVAPVAPGDEITAEAEVLEVRDDKPISKLRTTITNQDGTVVLDGTALVYREPLG